MKLKTTIVVGDPKSLTKCKLNSLVHHFDLQTSEDETERQVACRPHRMPVIVPDTIKVIQNLRETRNEGDGAKQMML